MSLGLLKRSLPKQTEDNLPSKRPREPSATYSDLIQQEIDKRLFRAQKPIKKSTIKPKPSVPLLQTIEEKSQKSKPKPSVPLLQTIEEKSQKSKPKNSFAQNLQNLNSRTLSNKYLSMITKTLK